jgi:hypothetical protein
LANHKSFISSLNIPINDHIITEYSDKWRKLWIGFYDVTRCYLCNNTYISINIWNLADAYLQQEASSWGIFATGGLWVFYGTLYGFYDVTRCYLCNNTYISINIWNLEKKIIHVVLKF